MSKVKKTPEEAMGEALVESGLIPRLREYSLYVPTMTPSPMEEIVGTWAAAVLASLRGWTLERERDRASYERFLEKIFDPSFAASTPSGLPPCSKCQSRGTTVRWDANYYDCLRKEQDRHDWPESGDEHLHYSCLRCGWTWAVPSATNPIVL